MIKLINILLEANESSKEYQRQRLAKIKQNPEAYAKYLEKSKENQRQYLEKLKQDPEAYAKWLEKLKLYSKKHQDKLKQDPEAYAKYLKSTTGQIITKNKIKKEFDKLKQDPEAYAKYQYEKNWPEYLQQLSDFFYNTITNNPSPELNNIKNNHPLLNKIYSEFIERAKKQYQAKNKDFSFMVTENKK